MPELSRISEVCYARAPIKWTVACSGLLTMNCGKRCGTRTYTLFILMYTCTDLYRNLDWCQCELLNGFGGVADVATDSSTFCGATRRGASQRPDLVARSSRGYPVLDTEQGLFEEKASCARRGGYTAEWLRVTTRSESLRKKGSRNSWLKCHRTRQFTLRALRYGMIHCFVDRSDIIHK